MRAALPPGWAIAVLVLPTAAAMGACSLGFDTFDPVATSAGDAGPTADTGQGGNDVVEDVQSLNDTGSEAAADSGTASDSPCTVQQSCLGTAASCGMNCAQGYQQCLGQCGGGNQCRQRCRGMENMCRSACDDACLSCTTSTGCTASSDCMTASAM